MTTFPTYSKSTTEFNFVGAVYILFLSVLFKKSFSVYFCRSSLLDSARLDVTIAVPKNRAKLKVLSEAFESQCSSLQFQIQ